MGSSRVLRGAVAVGAIAASAMLARGRATPAADERLTALVTRDRGPALDRVVGALTDIGSVYGLAGLSGALAAGGERRLALRTAVAGGLAWVTAQVTKDVLDRERPYELGTAELLIEVPHGSSWPSGHAAVAGAMAATTAPSLTPAGAVGAWATAVGVALSRLYVGAHHATDTVAGLALGVLSAEASSALLDRILPPEPTRSA